MSLQIKGHNVIAAAAEGLLCLASYYWGSVKYFLNKSTHIPRSPIADSAEFL